MCIDEIFEELNVLHNEYCHYENKKEIIIDDFKKLINLTYNLTMNLGYFMQQVEKDKKDEEEYRYYKRMGEDM